MGITIPPLDKGGSHTQMYSKGDPDQNTEKWGESSGFLHQNAQKQTPKRNTETSLLNYNYNRKSM
jgi:hypothetical protein